MCIEVSQIFRKLYGYKIVLIILIVRMEDKMFKGNLIRNKLYGLALIGIGMLSVLIGKDATFFLIALILGGYLIISKENWID